MAQGNPSSQGADSSVPSSLEECQELFNNAPIGIVTTTPEGRLLSANPAMASMFGYDSPDELIEYVKGIVIQLYADSSDRDELMRLLSENDAVLNFEFRGICRDGSMIWASTNVSAVRDNKGKLSHFQSFLTDITQRKYDQETIDVANARLEALWSISSLTATDFMKIADHCLDSLTRMTRSGYAFFGFIDEAESTMVIHSWSGDTMQDCKMQDKPVHFPIEQAGVWSEAVRQRTPLIINNYKVEHAAKKGFPEGHVGLTNLLVVPFISNGKITSVAAVANSPSGYSQDDVKQITAFLRNVQEIIDRKQAEEALRESSERFSLLLDAAHDGIWDWNVSTGEVYYSPRYATILGYDSTELPPHVNSWLNLIHPEDQEKVYKANLDCINHLIASFAVEFRMQAKNGDWLWIMGRGKAAERDASGTAVRMIGTHSDITDRKREELLQQVRLRLLQFAKDRSLDELLKFIIDEAESLTDSNTGFMHFIEEDQQTVSLLVRSTSTTSEICRIKDLTYHYSIENAGIWVDCVHQRQPVIHNDYINLAHRRGVPEGHVSIERLLVAPVFRDEQIVAVLGVGNKQTPYQETDAEMLTRLADLTWEITERKLAEEALRESRENYQLLIENLNEGIWQIDQDGYTVFVNDRMAEMLGYTVQEMQGKHLFNFMDEQEAQLTKSYMQRRQEGIKEQHEHTLICKDGSYIFTSLATSPVYDKDGKYIGALAGIQDITARKKALEAIRESESRFRRLLADIPSVAVQGYTMEGVTSYWNKASENLYGYSAHEAIGQNLVDLIIPEEMRTQVQAEIQQMADSGEPIPSSELTIKRKDGSSVLVFSSHVIVHKHDGSSELFCIDIDLTELKKAQGAILRAKEHAEAANQAKSQFLANMSHEIRTPLNGIMGIHQLLQTTNLDEEQNEYLEMAHNASQRLNRLLSDILDLSRIESGRIELKEDEFILKELKQSVEDIFRHTCHENNNTLQITLDENVPEKCFGDSTRLTQILFNLVGNALKYTRNGEVILQISSLPGTSPKMCRLLFVVKDNGPGIPEDKIEHIFETFTQANESDSPYTRQYEGAGLGLPLVKRLVCLMGGNACICSQSGQGTTFYVGLPFKVPEALQQQAGGLQEERNPASAGAAHVLLVDDEQSSQLYIRRLLEKNGYWVTVAENGEEALAKLAQDQYDCVLMDVQMPVLDGVEATKKIRSSNLVFKDSPIIALTAYAMAGDREKFLEAGMDDYLAKPVDKDELLTVLERNLSGSQ